MNRRTFLTKTTLGAAGSLLFTPVYSDKLGQVVTYSTTPKPDNAKFIWYDATGAGRNLYANFRKKITISNVNEVADDAKICLFADTSYLLFINGKFVHQGPVRFDPRYPMYDEIKIKRYLQNGDNVVAVQANYFGMKTYKSIPNQAGFVAWGAIKTANNTIDLSTHANSGWKVKPAGERSLYAKKLSFALNPCDLYDQSKEEIGWNTINANDESWPAPTELDNQNAWGIFSVRKIPYFEYAPVNNIKVLNVYPLVARENIHSFSVPVPDFYDDDRKSGGIIGYYTYIYSPVAQTVPVAGFWGETWINGVETPSGSTSLNQPFRIIKQWKLNKGWNFVFEKVGLYIDEISIYWGLPVDRELIVSADKDPSTGVIFRRMPLLTKEQHEAFMKNRKLPLQPTDALSDIGGWVNVTAKDRANNPAFETSWDFYYDPIENFKQSQELQGKTFSKSKYPNGVCILLDMDYTHLCFPKLNFSGVKGATIDITFSEQLTPDNVHLFHMHHFQIADRILCSEDTVEWMPPHPRGMRFVNVTVTNYTSDITINGLEFLRANYPVKLVGSFQSNDALLNQIWEVCERTQFTNMEDAYVDCVGRERGMYVRDTIIQYYNNLAAYGDQLLMERCMELYGQSPVPESGKFRSVYPNGGNYTIADFSLNCVEGFKVYYDNTGDKEFIARFWPEMLRNLSWFDALADERPQDLLLDAEWDKKRNEKSYYGGFHGDLDIIPNYMSKAGIHCLFTCKYLIALSDAYQMGLALNKTQDCQKIKRRIDILKKSVSEKFWDEAKSCYADNLSKTTHSAHASIFAVLAGAATSQQMEKIKIKVKNDFKSLFKDAKDPESGVYTSPSFAFYIFKGLYALELPGVAEKLMKDGWGWVVKKGMKTVPEYFNFRPHNSMCHAWSASPMYYLSKHVLGVDFPKAPDLNYVEIKVMTYGVTEAEGKWPHPKGEIAVKWHTENSKRVFDYVKVPDGVQFKVVS